MRIKLSRRTDTLPPRVTLIEYLLFLVCGRQHLHCDELAWGERFSSKLAEARAEGIAALSNST